MVSMIHKDFGFHSASARDQLPLLRRLAWFRIAVSRVIFFVPKTLIF